MKQKTLLIYKLPSLVKEGIKGWSAGKKYFRNTTPTPPKIEGELKVKFKFAATLILILFFLTSCGEIMNKVFDPPNGEVEITEFTPAQGQTNVEINSAVTFEFNQPVAQDTLSGSVFLTGAAGNAVSGKMGFEKKLVIFTPDSPLAYNTKYTMKVTTGVTNYVGDLPMKQEYVWSFITTGTELVTVSPTPTPTGEVVTVAGLMWQREDDDQTRTWQAAIDYCDGLSLGGYSDWRLPSIDELKLIIDKSRTNPAIDTTSFPNTNSSSYWSATTYATNSGFAWYVHFSNGGVYYYDKTYSYYVRCVR